MSRRLVVVLLMGALFLPAYACSVPWLAHKDKDLGLTHLEAGVLRGEAARWSKLSKLPLGPLQIIEAHRDYSGDPAAIHGVVVWRTVFGIEYARTDVHGQESQMVWRNGEFQRAWLMLIAPELATIGLAFILFLRVHTESEGRHLPNDYNEKTLR